MVKGHDRFRYSLPESRGFGFGLSQPRLQLLLGHLKIANVGGC